MKVSELKRLINDFDENLELVVGDYDEIADEEGRVFHEINGIEKLTDDSKVEFVCIHFTHH